jgi:hypothetical protein
MCSHVKPGLCRSAQAVANVCLSMKPSSTDIATSVYCWDPCETGAQWEPSPRWGVGVTNVRGTRCRPSIVSEYPSSRPLRISQCRLSCMQGPRVMVRYRAGGDMSSSGVAVTGRPKRRVFDVILKRQAQPPHTKRCGCCTTCTLLLLPMVCSENLGSVFDNRPPLELPLSMPWFVTCRSGRL